MEVALFVPCMIDQFRPSTARNAVEILERLGLSVKCFPDQTCCGQPLYKSGYRRKTLKLAKNVIRLFENAEYMVIPSGSCVAMIRKEYPELLQDQGRWLDRAIDLSSKVFELTEFICRILRTEDLGAAYPGKVTFHDSCQVSRALGITEEPRRLLANVKGLELIEMDKPNLCCGFGGTFSIKYPWISTAMREEKIARIEATGAEALVSCEPSCLMHIENGLRQKGLKIPVLHIVDILHSKGS